MTPYSPLRIAGNFFWLSGISAKNPTTGLIEGDSFRKQSEYVFERIVRVLGDAGIALDQVTRFGVYLHRGSHFSEFNDLYRTFLVDVQDKPARTTIVCDFVLPKMLIEIDACGVMDGG